MTREIIFLKLGGSLITNKDSPYTPRLKKLENLAQEIKAALDASPKTQMALGHGSGSFGHTAAKRFGTREGLQADVSAQAYWLGFAEVRYQAAELVRHVIKALLDAGVAALPISPSATIISSNRNAAVINVSTIRKALAAGLLPVVHGDVAFDEMLGGTILSTEDVFAFLAEQIPPSRILLAGVEPGVWADFPARGKLLKEIRLADYETIRAGVGGSASADVTGGMKAKVEKMFALIQKHPRLTAQIFSAQEEGSLSRALAGENVGTLLRA